MSPVIVKSDGWGRVLEPILYGVGMPRTVTYDVYSDILSMCIVFTLYDSGTGLASKLLLIERMLHEEGVNDRLQGWVEQFKEEIDDKVAEQFQDNFKGE